MPSAYKKIQHNVEFTVHNGNESHIVESGSRTTKVKQLEKGTFKNGRDEHILAGGQKTHIHGNEERSILSDDQVIEVKGDQVVTISSGTRSLEVGLFGVDKVEGKYDLTVEKITERTYGTSVEETYDKTYDVKSSSVTNTFKLGIEENVTNSLTEYNRNGGFEHNVTSGEWITDVDGDIDIWSSGNIKFDSPKIEILGNAKITIETPLHYIYKQNKETEKPFKGDVYIASFTTRIFDEKAGTVLGAVNWFSKSDYGLIKLDNYIKKFGTKPLRIPEKKDVNNDAGSTKAEMAVVKNDL
ncbi:hypothetical protein [Taylorella asinigenitalis]|uniref:Uncharacterized protein n=1 Tax=Taylorella asinigenitalis (strain MCE3) TaxID=1008459 RepID=G4QD83_TAYAM|nr:hypothetical protein [Taylorella asinigenitalis]AEP35900.1 hypothetical protein TASI_0109 [Taylorella asinigenitalis MCE3]